MKNIFNKLDNTGSTLIELIIAVMIVGLIVTAVAVASTYSIKNTGEARFKQVATTLGQEAIEFLRSEKNRLGFINFNTTFGSNTFCFANTPIETTPSAGVCGEAETLIIAGGTFTREAGVTVDGTSGITTLVITVSWEDNANTRSVVLEQEFKEANTSF